ncbi:hypothetical protein O8B93_27820 [Agrobacterium rhizogenes]|uniref:hypothetical protein n=1 Tax=Rhizobium rhizogenes TaxID=359 RepID=UPI0022B6B623|nr:hypothetical protein [Rhizobium rhizogenes]MCZ7451372.1 hypothetical protein [Rhizobium rhizogenes]
MRAGDKRRLGSTDLSVTALSMGCASLGGLYAPVSATDALVTLQAAPAEIVRRTEELAEGRGVAAKIGNQQVHCLFHERLNLGPGAIIHLQPEAGKVHLFGASGERLVSK